jgi:gamma-glutamylputrescine oxidase
MARVYPALARVRLTHAWGGTLAITTTRGPYMQRVGANILAASLCSGHGVALSTQAGRVLAEAIAGHAGRFDTLSALTPPAFPGGAVFRWPILVMAMSWFALRDRLGV